MRPLTREGTLVGVPTPFLNVDAGEHDDEPEELYALADALNVACGGHAGDALSMTRVIEAALDAGTRVGAHPSYDDREGFGRRALHLPIERVARGVEVQCAALAAIALGLGASVEHAKLHGALYHEADRDDRLATACVEAIVRALGPVMILGPRGGALERAARVADLAYAIEGFADRARRSDGTLVPRSEPGALIEDPDEARRTARRLAPSVDTLCVHADTRGALGIARAVRDELDRMLDEDAASA